MKFKDKINVVEAMGVEPMSVLLQNASATCLVPEYTMQPLQKQEIYCKPEW